MKVKSEREVAQSCPTLCDPMDCSPPGSSVNGIFQARVLEWDVGFTSGAEVKNLPANAGNARDAGLILGSGRSSGVGNGNPLQYSCLENSMDRGVWWATVHRAAKSWTVLSISTDKVWQQTKIRLNRNDLES